MHKILRHSSVFYLFLFIFISFSSWAHAGAVVARKRQGQDMQQQAEQAQYDAARQSIIDQQQAQVDEVKRQVAQQQAQQQAEQQAQIEAVRQMMQQKAMQAQIEAQIAAYMQQAQIEMVQQAQQEMLKKAIAQELTQRIAQQVAQGQAVQVQQSMIQQAVAQTTQQMIAQKMIAVQQINRIKVQNDQEAAAAQAAAAQNAAAQEAVYQVQGAAVEQVAAAKAMQQRQYDAAMAARLGPAAAAVEKPYEQVPPQEVKDVVDIAEVWARLEHNSKAWLLLIDNQAKFLTVKEFIERYGKQKVSIRKPPMYYVQMIDAMAAQNPTMLNNSFGQVLQVLAVMEYDFDNGVDRDLVARKILGSQGYEANKKRLGK